MTVFSRQRENLFNGLGETVEIEDPYGFPLLKSSDLANGRLTLRKAVLVTQRHIGDATAEIEHKAPKTWPYLQKHRDYLDRRKSTIYKNRPRFSVFGIGSYSFSAWKIALSGLYKNISFVVVPPWEGKPVMVDDTCYFISCHSRDEASLMLELLSSAPANKFLRALIFLDAKRPITIDVLRRISFVNLAREIGQYQKFQYITQQNRLQEVTQSQSLWLMESKQKYQT